MPTVPKPVLTIVLDGWGYREEPDDNAIAHARTPAWDGLWAKYPRALIHGSGADVGLPQGQMGNSEVGHLNLGAGRIVSQEFTRISQAIKDGSFFSNSALTAAVDLAKNNGKAVHILGLLSDGGVHSHVDHFHAMLKLAIERGAQKVYLHAFTDGRDCPPKSAETFIKDMQANFEQLGNGRFASLIGRYFAMDRDNRWPRVQAAYDLISQGKAEFQAENALGALQAAYERGESDEFLQATAIVPAGEKPLRVEDGDTVIFMNYRSDRARQLSRPFIEADFREFERAHAPRPGTFVSLTEYSANFDVAVAFPATRLKNVFGEIIARQGLRQLRIAETEKYAHVTFFFNGGREDVFEGEDRILVPSPNVATYDQQPEMSANELTDKLVEAITSGNYDTIICNYANPDMVGHTGNLPATVKAIETLDNCLGRVVEALEQVGGEALITADHGNAEQLSNRQTGQAHTAHTSNPVPLVYVGRPGILAANGSLCDIAPTMLMLMGLQQPSEMSGHSLLTLTGDNVQTKRPKPAEKRH